MNVQYWRRLCEATNELRFRYPESRLAKLEPRVLRAVELNQVNSLLKDPLLSPSTLCHNLTTLLRAEECYEQISKREFDCDNATITFLCSRDNRTRVYGFQMHGVARGQPKLVPGDQLLLEPKSDHNGAQAEVGVIDSIANNRIEFTHRAAPDSIRLDQQELMIRFVSNGAVYDRCVWNLRKIQPLHHFRAMFFRRSLLGKTQQAQVHYGSSLKIDLEATNTPHLKGRLALCDEHQQRAIKNILAARCRPNAYVVFGPPGTGKTRTLVETVIQIYKRDPNARVLVSAGSNNCADHLALKLDESGEAESMLRLYSASHARSLKQIPEYFVSADELCLRESRVLITTNMMSPWARSNHYDFVLMDEAGHENIPGALLTYSRMKVDGCFVLAGDPKQLGPVVKSRDEYVKRGLSRSFLQHLFEDNLYGCHLGAYDERLITELIISYRCDPRILSLCNKLFYKSKLQCRGETPPSILKMLRFKNPLVYHSIEAKDDKEGFSRYNEREAEICVGYLLKLFFMGFEPHQVGIMSLYGSQKWLILEKFEERLEAVKPELNSRFKLSRESRRLQIEPRPECGNSQTNKGSRSTNNTDQGSEDLDKSNARAKIKQRKRIYWAPKNLKWSSCKIDTCDAFQGNEREVIILSTVRSPNENRAIVNKFLSNGKRFNVAMSRSKWLTIVVGHPAVMSARLWSDFERSAFHSPHRFPSAL